MRKTKADNVLLFNHYPSNYFQSNNRRSFIDAVKQGPSNNAKIFYFGGHTHNVEKNYGINTDPAEEWLVGGGGGWGCDGNNQGAVVGYIYKNSAGRFTIKTESLLIPKSQCCKGGGGGWPWGRRLEEDEAEPEYRTGKWWEAQLKLNHMWNQTCGGLECQERLDLLKKFRHVERMEGKTAEETWAAELLRSEAEHEKNKTPWEPSQFFKDTIEAIRKEKA